MSNKILIISDDNSKAEQYISTFTSTQLSFSTTFTQEEISGAIIVSSGSPSTLNCLSSRYTQLINNVRRFPIAIVSMNNDKALSDKSYAYVEVSEIILPVSAIVSGIHARPCQQGQRAIKAFKDGSFIQFLESYIQKGFMTVEPEKVSNAARIVIKPVFKKHGKWGWLPRE
ncbi:hypothetical protein SS50377_27856 [Spironucleus salmonicida]|uniref:Uncharacterized protein n=1 Tax=Spironucleus salmonicida TaxID=348837 RepID=V6LX59_9EUKA|nr:hypothetical protein SS50377_27856 [Spironucleus salmonicida]|eukprot:EST48828.1 Hypothetical protein SS50377_10924 [Spironucleus salmonicida]